EDRHAALTAVLFLGLLPAAERYEGPPARFVGRHARAAVVLNMHRQMCVEFITQVLIGPTSRNQTDHSSQGCEQASHRCAPSAPRNPAKTSVACPRVLSDHSVLNATIGSSLAAF